jgi:preprotein translocase subunit SecG
VPTILAIGQMLVAIALVASILMQSRGAGLGATFGGDSSVYRSRRGIEKRLFQFTVVLAILFVIFAVAGYALSPASAPAEAPAPV